MKRRRRILAACGVGLLVLLATAVCAVYVAAGRGPEFYPLALQADPKQQAIDADRMVQQAAALSNNVRHGGRWEVAFTTAQVNAWLALELPKAIGGPLPGDLADPRVEITPAGITVACRRTYGGRDYILSLQLDAYLVEKNVPALRIRSVRVGRLPLPMDRVLRELSRSLARLEWPIEWRQAGGDPVAQITIPSSTSRPDRILEIDSLRLEQGKLIVGGQNRPRQPSQ